MPSRNFTIQAAVLALSALLPGAAAAASPDAWATFRRDVEAACLAAAAPLVTQPQIVVDPFGSESYGLAFINGVAVEGGTTRSLVCIYDKVARTAEIGGTMALEQAVPSLQPDPVATDGIAAAAPAKPTVAEPAAAADAAPAVTLPSPAGEGATFGNDAGAAAAALSERFLSPSAAPAVNAMPAEVAALAATPAETAASGEGASGFAGQCDAACATTLQALGAPDRQELLDLSAEVKRTIDRNAAASLGEGPAKAREAALAVAASVEGGKLGAVAVPTAALAGERSCVLYYYGYSGEASRTVGRHRCAVSAGEGGALVVEKTSGERLRAEVKPLTGEVAAFVGRTYENGQSETRYDAAKPVSAENSELGNTVGFAAASDEGLVLVSSQRRRFADADDFFWVLAVDPK